MTVAALQRALWRAHPPADLPPSWGEERADPAAFASLPLGGGRLGRGCAVNAGGTANTAPSTSRRHP